MCVCLCAHTLGPQTLPLTHRFSHSLARPVPLTSGVQPPIHRPTTHPPTLFSSSSFSSSTSDSLCQYPVTLSGWSHNYHECQHPPPPSPSLSLSLSPSPSHTHTHICSHNLCSQTCPVLSPWLSQPLSRAQVVLGKRGQASPSRMLMMSLTSGLQGREEKWLWKAKITSLLHLLITYLVLDMHAGAPQIGLCGNNKVSLLLH